MLEDENQEKKKKIASLADQVEMQQRELEIFRKKGNAARVTLLTVVYCACNSNNIIVG